MYRCKIVKEYDENSVLAEFYVPIRIDYNCIFIGIKIDGDNFSTVLSYNEKNFSARRLPPKEKDIADEIIYRNIDEVSIEVKKALKRWDVEKYL